MVKREKTWEICRYYGQEVTNTHMWAGMCLKQKIEDWKTKKL